MSTGSSLDTGARTGAQYLDGLRADGREIWLGGERIDDVVSHPKLGAAARSMAMLFDFQHERPDEMLMPRPTPDGRSTSRTCSPRARPTSSGGASRSSSGPSCTAASWAARPTT